MFPERKTNNKDSVTKLWMIFVQSWQLRRVSNVNVNVTLFKGFMMTWNMFCVLGPVYLQLKLDTCLSKR